MKLTNRAANVAYAVGWGMASGGLLAQAVQIYCTRSAEDVSFLFPILYMLGYLAMFLRGWTSGYRIWWLGHLAAILLGASILAGKLVYG